MVIQQYFSRPLYTKVVQISSFLSEFIKFKPLTDDLPRWEMWIGLDYRFTVSYFSSIKQWFMEGDLDKVILNT